MIVNINNYNGRATGTKLKKQSATFQSPCITCMLMNLTQLQRDNNATHITTHNTQVG